MSFDFDAAVSAPFRMQPGLRRLASGARQLTPMRAGSRHQREKLAVLCAYPQQALVCAPGFDPLPALHALCSHAAQEHPAHWQWQGQRATAAALGVAVEDGRWWQTAEGAFGLGDELGRCLEALPPAQRLGALLALAFEEDLAIVDGPAANIAWICGCLPSHWAPERKVGRHFAEVHAPVADSERLRAASEHLMRLVCGPERWERFVWNVTHQPRLHAHPDRVDPLGWTQTQRTAFPADAWWRTERQTFLPVPDLRQAVFTIHVQASALAEALDSPARAAALHAAVESMSDAVLDYRNLHPVRGPLLRWLADRARAQGVPDAGR